MTERILVPGVAQSLRNTLASSFVHPLEIWLRNTLEVRASHLLHWTQYVILSIIQLQERSLENYWKEDRW